MAALERGENPGGLQEAYKRAVEQAELKFGPSEKAVEAPDTQIKAANTGVEPASQEVAEQLENALLDTMFDGLNPGNTSKTEQENLREEFRGYIRQTQAYNKMILSGNANISNILGDPAKMALVYGDVARGISDQLGLNENEPQNNEPQISNEKTMNQNENVPVVPTF